MKIEFQHVYYKRKKFSLQDLNFEIQEGFITALVGKNGAGKTTLFHLLLDPNVKYEGRILVNGEEWRESRIKWLKYIGFVSDENKFFMELTALENAKMLQWIYEDLFSMEQYQNNMEQMGLSLHQCLKDMSRGEYIKYQLAFAMAHQSQLYLLDEATAGMDVVFKKEFFRLLHQLLIDETCTVFMSTHIQQEIETHMDYVLEIRDGNIIAGRETDGRNLQI